VFGQVARVVTAELIATLRTQCREEVVENMAKQVSAR
jgi:hypothetical protein